MCQKHSHQNHVIWVVILTSVDTSCSLSPRCFHKVAQLFFFFFFHPLTGETGKSVSSETESLSFLYYPVCRCLYTDEHFCTGTIFKMWEAFLSKCSFDSQWASYSLHANSYVQLQIFSSNRLFPTNKDQLSQDKKSVFCRTTGAFLWFLSQSVKGV